VIVLEIGPSSTSFRFGEDVWTAAVGADQLAAEELTSDPPRPEELLNAIGIVHDHLDDLLREHPEVEADTEITGTGEVIAVVAAVEVGSSDRARLEGLQLHRDAVEEVFRTLATERLADRLHNPGLPPEHGRSIVGGLCELVAVMRRLHLDSIRVSLSPEVAR